MSEKSIEERLREIESILDDAAAQKLCVRRDKYPIWDIILPSGGCLLVFVSRSMFKRLDKIAHFMDQILQIAIDSDENTYLDYKEDPAKYLLPGKWEKVGDYTWKVAADANASELERKFLYYGSWDFYIDETPGQNLKTNPFTGKPDALLQEMRENTFKLLISSFPDDLRWAIALDLPEKG